MKLKILNGHECPEMKPKKNKIEMHEQIYFTLKTIKYMEKAVTIMEGNLLAIHAHVNCMPADPSPFPP